jgi:hypothetical protein
MLEHENRDLSNSIYISRDMSRDTLIAMSIFFLGIQLRFTGP